jgi:hypothetical protein
MRCDTGLQYPRVSVQIRYQCADSLHWLISFLLVCIKLSSMYFTYFTLAAIHKSTISAIGVIPQDLLSGEHRERGSETTCQHKENDRDGRYVTLGDKR